MSDYSHGSSLRAASSKANYLFEGDFKRRPNQNLSGASRSLARGELLQQAAEQRQNREFTRQREQASLKIQSIWRGYSCRKFLATEMRTKFDKLIIDIKTKKPAELENEEFDMLTREFIIHYNSKLDQNRFNVLLELIMDHQDMVIKLKQKEPKIWLLKMVKLLTMNLGFMKTRRISADSIYLKFLERLTREGKVLDRSQACIVWQTLVKNKLYVVLRLIIDSSDMAMENGQSLDNDLSHLLIEIVRRSLDYEPLRYDQLDASLYAFFNELFQGPLDSIIDDHYLSKILSLHPTSLRPKHILETFARAHESTLWRYKCKSNFSPIFVSNSDQIQQCSDAIWLSYTFVRTIYTQIDQLGDSEKAEYIGVLSNLLGPAIYITNICLMQAANDGDFDESEDSEDFNPLSGNHQYQTEINSVITRLVNLINHQPHINHLKSIIFNKKLQEQVQSGIVQICNLMLAHEPMAIFNCRLLYTVAFSREFSRSLWKSIISSTSTTLYGTTTTTYSQLARGNNISRQSWNTILPQLELFCSLYSYLLPTLDDENFYCDSDEAIFANDSERQYEEQSALNNSNINSSFFVGKEWISIIGILRDICVGLIGILYRDNKLTNQQSPWGFETQLDEDAKLLDFEIKICFKALVRLICQLHARDSRKQFCPDGHWISPFVAIPANKAINFQLVSSKQGRLLSQMTRDDNSAEWMPTSSSEIKTVLILQEIPFVISFYDRVQILHQLLQTERQMHQSDGYYFGLAGTAIHVQVRRNYIYEDAFEKLSLEKEPNMKLPLKVSLINAVGANEAGIDGGGLSKEFLSELLKAGFDPMRGFFKSTKDQHLYPNPSANVLFSSLPEGYEIHYEFLGRMLGKAIFEKIMVELPLASFFLAKLIARKHSSDVDLHNLASLDPVLYKNLVYLKNYQGDVADLDLDFTISNNELGEHEVVELKPGGSKIPVTRDNKIEYVHLVADYRLNKQIRAQCAAFKRGLSQLIDLDWLRMFDSRELQILISGAPTVIDIDDWRRHTIYGKGYSDDCEAINIFWKVASQFDENQKRKLLKFATSCSLPPLLGFKDLVPQFAIAPTEVERLPTASTCMNLLKLPQCNDEGAMRSKLLYAIESNSGFELS